jgi:ferritin
MINERIQAEINKQINEEMYSAYLYLSMSAYFTSINLNGFANWMTVQSQEEMIHAMKFYNFLHERNGRVELDVLAKPTFEWESPLAAFEAAYKHEQHITGRINDMMEAAVEEKDHATQIFLQWFVTEQVEEEASALEVIDKLNFIGDSKHGLYMLDREMAQRAFTSPSANGE